MGMTNPQTYRNQPVVKQELDAIRALDDVELIQLITTIHDKGWPTARELLPAKARAAAKRWRMLA
jgi:hypothetical protein